MRSANLLLKFLLELAAFAAFAYAGLALFHGPAAVVVAIALPLAVIAAWGRFAAPRAPRRLPVRSRIPFELGVFAVAAVLLYVSGAGLLGDLFVVLVVLNAVLLTAFSQWEG